MPLAWPTPPREYEDTLKGRYVIQHEVDGTFHQVVDDEVPCSGLVLPGSRNSPEAAKAI